MLKISYYTDAKQAQKDFGLATSVYPSSQVIGITFTDLLTNKNAIIELKQVISVASLKHEDVAEIMAKGGKNA
jgi:hypothetical protein